MVEKADNPTGDGFKKVEEFVDDAGEKADVFESGTMVGGQPGSSKMVLSADGKWSGPEAAERLRQMMQDALSRASGQ